jgi:hypothetical protein
MAILTIYKCDSCGVLKGEKENGWWYVVFADHHIVIEPLSPGCKTDAVHFCVCGRACVQTLVEQFMDRYMTRSTH